MIEPQLTTLAPIESAYVYVTLYCNFILIVTAPASAGLNTVMHRKPPCAPHRNSKHHISQQFLNALS